MVEQSGNESGEKNTGIRRLINSGLEIAGGAVGGALGFLANTWSRWHRCCYGIETHRARGLTTLIRPT